MIGQPTGHFRHALHREPATFKGLPKPVQPRIAILLESRGLLRNTRVLGQAVSEGSADAGEAQAHRARDVGRHPARSIRWFRSGERIRSLRSMLTPMIPSHRVQHPVERQRVPLSRTQAGDSVNVVESAALPAAPVRLRSPLRLAAGQGPRGPPSPEVTEPVPMTAQRR